MKYSQMLFRSGREAPRDAQTLNHKLLVQAGYVRQLMAGVYTYLPLGLRVLNNIAQIVREEMNLLGSTEILMPLLHPAAIWKQTGGWDGIDVLFKLKSRTDKEYALASSHEEAVTPLARELIYSGRDLPMSMYQIQWKFRDELRSKSGILRGREFLMKDMYSWHLDQADFDQYYARVKAAYLRVFDRMGLVAKVTEASGGSFTDKLSYEFEVLTDAGEANILYCERCDYCVNIDDIQTVKVNDICPRCQESQLQSSLAAEVGNVFDLGQKYTKAFDLTVANAPGEKIYPVMGCYGIGISRTMGVVVEKFADAKGLVWPKAVAPFGAHLVEIKGQKSKIKTAEEIYETLAEAGIEVLYDDTDRPAGEKLTDADLLGMPVRLVVSDRTAGKIEWKRRAGDKVELLEVNEVIKRLG